ncbi:MAG: imidazolonepropionase [Firmicutes bacterium HGW-Firmicutes-1]|nr:MAG: imidazolonepropionase [Firmicutes bacterium HGW-Firmicutes-1]
MDRIVIKNANELITCSGFAAKAGKDMNQLGIIYNGAIIIEEGMIKAVGETKDIVNEDLEKNSIVIDAANKIVLPGFVDSHTHFVFGGYRAEEYGWRLMGEDYMSIMKRGGGIANSVRATREASHNQLLDAGVKRLNSMLGFGVTTVEGKSGYGLDYATEMKQLKVMKELNEKHPLDIVATFMGAHSVPDEFKDRADDYIEYLLEEVLPDVASDQLAEYCDVFCEEGVFSVEQSEKLLVRAKELGFKIKIHSDEIVDLGGAKFSADMGAVTADHLLMASNEGLERMKERGIIATLLPGTAFSLKKPYARARYMIDQGLAVALASDFNPGSCYSESIPLIIALATLQMNMTTEEAITALTINGAAALNRAENIGSLDVGKIADIVIHDCPTYHFLSYHIGVSTVETVIKRGQIVLTERKSKLL